MFCDNLVIVKFLHFCASQILTLLVVIIKYVRDNCESIYTKLESIEPEHR